MHALTVVFLPAEGPSYCWEAQSCWWSGLPSSQKVQTSCQKVHRGDAHSHAGMADNICFSLVAIGLLYASTNVNKIVSNLVYLLLNLRPCPLWQCQPLRPDMSEVVGLSPALSPEPACLLWAQSLLGFTGFNLLP